MSKAVGNAVTRNLVKRRLRHLLADRLSQRERAATEPRCDFVVRAFPPAATATYAELGADLDATIASITGKLQP